VSCTASPCYAIVDMRQATVDDLSPLLLLMEAFNEAEGISWRPAEMGSAAARLLADPSLGTILVAERETKELVAYAVATFGYDLEFAGRDAFITELFVDQRSRGNGLGTALLAATIEFLKTAGALAVHLMVRPENATARRLYGRLGFYEAPRIMMTKEFD